MKLMRNVILFWLNLFVCSSVLLAAELPSYKVIEMQINDAKKLDKNDSNNALVKHLEETRSLLEKIAQQKNDNEDLTKEIKGASVALGISQMNIEKLKNIIVPTVDMLEKSSIGDLQKALASLEAELEMIQTELTTINGNLVAQNTVPDKAQLALADNATRRQMINAALGNTNLSSAEKVKFETELTLLDLQNGYNYDLLRGTEELTTLYDSQLDEKKLAQ
ncbi:potassium efflux protein KefA [[Haemophilus] ducreyi]|nr:potassium efflux protein KefA [[Haemophilus] ducreyi]